MLKTTCTLDGASLQLVDETFDLIDRVYVGILRCPQCGTEYVDSRKPHETRLEQLRLPEVE
jgi:hypothetical protein